MSPENTRKAPRLLAVIFTADGLARQSRNQRNMVAPRNTRTERSDISQNTKAGRGIFNRESARMNAKLIHHQSLIR
jgi:hypothetical protein